MKGIIVEGPDGAGKSTLIRQLADDLGRLWVHTGGSNKSVSEIDRKCREQAEWLRQGWILDRCAFISDPIYKNALGQSILRTQAILRARLWMLDPVIIYCRRGNWAEMLEAIVETKKSHKPPEYLAQVKKTYPLIVQGYDTEMLQLKIEGFQVLSYDWSKNDYHQLLETVIKCVA